MDPLTAGLNLALSLAHLEELYVEGLTAEQKAARSTRLYDLIDFVLDKADKAHAFLHRHDAHDTQEPTA